MPEGPECTRAAKQVHRAVYNKKLVHIELCSGRYTKKAPDGYERALDILEHAPTLVSEVRVKGKFIYWVTPDFYIYTTLGMTGNFKLQPSKHTRVAFYFDDESSIYYNDQRNFGTIKFVFSLRDLEKKLSSIGPDMLNNPCTLEAFKELTQKRSHYTLVKWLMDQSLVSGVGNIYKSESLFLAGLNPSRTVSSLDDSEIEKLYLSICRVLRAAYEEGGATIKNYSDLYNNHGKYTAFPSNVKDMLEARWDNRVMIYGRTHDVYGNKVEKIKLDDGRTTYWSPQIQQ